MSQEQKKEEVVEETIVESQTEESEGAKSVASEEVQEKESEEKTLTQEEVVAPIESTPKKLKKHDEAKQLVQEAERLVSRSKEELEACRQEVVEDFHRYEEAKEALYGGVLAESKALLQKLEDEEIGSVEVESEVLPTPEALAQPLAVKDVSSGKFTGLLLGLLGGVATLGTAVYYASTSLGLPIDTSHIPTKETLESIFKWVSKEAGQGESVELGAAMVGGASVLVMTLLYRIRVAMKGSKNLHFAKQQLDEALKYEEQKCTTKENMEAVDAHIHEAMKLLKGYEVLLKEKVGSLGRIYYIEVEEASEPEAYHHTSEASMKDTEMLIEAIEGFISKPLTQEGVCSTESQEALKKAKEVYEDYVEKLYA